MTDRQKVYTKTHQKLKELLKGQKQGHIATLAMMVSGIVLGKSGHLSKIAAEVPHPIREDSIEKRLSRFVKNDNIDVKTYFTPFARQILQRFRDKPMYFSMDGSSFGNGCMALVVGLVYKKRAIPICWIVYKGKKGHASAKRHIQVLELLKEIIPIDSDVTLLGDGEFDSVELLEWICQNTHWEISMRTAKNVQLKIGNEYFSFQDFCPQEGRRILFEDIGFTKQDLGPLNAVVWWGKGYKEPIFIVTTMNELNVVCSAYSKRFAIETFFSDQKSRGFGIDKSRIKSPERLERLLLGASLAFLWMVHLGLETIERGKKGLIDRKNRTDKSIFRLGMDWLRYCLKFGLPLTIEFTPPYVRSVR